MYTLHDLIAEADYCLVHCQGVSNVFWFSQLEGCSEPARHETYPRELHYIDEITQAMQQLSWHMQQLEDLTRPDKPSPQARLEILAALNGMDQSAAHLEASGWPRNHPP